MDDYKKIPFDDPDLCVPDLDDFDQMKEFFLDCAAEYFRYLSSDDMEKMLAALGKRVDVLATPTDDVFISVSPDAVLRQYPDITIDEAIQIRDNACENIWESGGQSDLDEIVWDQIGAEYKSIKSDSHRGLSDVKDMEPGRERALKMFGYLCRSQLFSDGNKRTAQLVANKMLIADGRGILAIPPECKHDFGEKLKRFYETADDSELQKFLIETSIYN